jgi:hypothetical protein
VLGNFEADRQVETAGQFDNLLEVDHAKVLSRDLQEFIRDLLAVNAEHIAAALKKGCRPGSDSAPDVQDGPGRVTVDQPGGPRADELRSAVRRSAASRICVTAS